MPKLMDWIVELPVACRGRRNRKPVAALSGGLSALQQNILADLPGTADAGEEICRPSLARGLAIPVTGYNSKLAKNGGSSSRAPAGLIGRQNAGRHACVAPWVE
jgi:hypothetical protein